MDSKVKRKPKNWNSETNFNVKLLLKGSVFQKNRVTLTYAIWSVYVFFFELDAKLATTSYHKKCSCDKKIIKALLTVFRK